MKLSKIKLSTSELIGVEKIDNMGLFNKLQQRLIFFQIQPSNLSVLPSAEIDKRITNLLQVLQAQENLEIVCLDNKQTFEDNKQYLKAQMQTETNLAIKELLRKDLFYLDKIQLKMATDRTFLFIIRVRPGDVEKYGVEKLEKLAFENGLLSRYLEAQEVKKMLSVYLAQTSQVYQNYDGERWVRLHDWS